MIWVGVVLAVAVVGLAVVGALAWRVWQHSRALSRSVGAAAEGLNASLAALQDALAPRDVP